MRRLLLLLALMISISLTACAEDAGQPQALPETAEVADGDQTKEEAPVEDRWVLVSEVYISDDKSENVLHYTYYKDGTYRTGSDRSYDLFDANGNLTYSKSYGTIRVLAYDDNGNLLSEGFGEDGWDHRVEYFYDDQGNCIEEKYYGDDKTVSTYVVMEYDDRGNRLLKLSTSEKGSYGYAYTYDEHNSETSRTSLENGKADSQLTYQFIYDADGRILQREAFKDGKSVQVEISEYNEKGLLVSYKEGPKNRNTTKKYIIYEYDEKDQRIYQKYMYDNGVTEHEVFFTYDEKGNLIYEKITWENNGAGQKLDDITERYYAYDDHGHKIREDHYYKGEYSHGNIWNYDLFSNVAEDKLP